MSDDFFPIDPHALRPFVYEDERTVSMHFDMCSTQSCMRRAAPYALELDYTRAMMGFLLVEPNPATMLMIGLGGGSLPKYCHRHLSATDITVVEINPHVIAMRDAFFVPRDDERFRVVCDDGARFVAASPARYDVLMVDGFNYDGQPAGLCSPEFYRACRAALTPTGVAVINLHLDEPPCNALVERIARAFDGEVCSLLGERGSNMIVLAGPASALRQDTVGFARRWTALADVHKRTLARCATRLARGLRATESA